MRWRGLFVLAGALLGLMTPDLSSPAVAAPPRVVASILPVQSLAANVMAGIAAPALLMRPTASAHAYSLRPSEARLLNEAGVIFWLGPAYETPLTKAIESAGGRARVVALMAAPGVAALPAREGGAWGEDDHGHSHAGDKRDEETDPHVFLDPENAKAIVRVMAATLSEADAGNRERYGANAEATIARIDALDGELTRLLTSARGAPYVVFHDGYQYFERRYGLNAIGSITVSPDRPPGARRLREMRRKITTLNAVCVFAEPQFDSALVGTVVDGTTARTGLLDYIGVTLPAGPDAYFAMMRGLARGLTDCLGG